MELSTERIMHMETDYEKQFIEILRSENPDYEYVKKLLHTEVDINSEINLLYEVLVECPENNMLGIIKFFLDNGYDVGKKNGQFGADCISGILFKTKDSREIEAVKQLLDAGTVNAIYDDGDSLLEYIERCFGDGELFFDNYDGDTSLDNLLIVIYEMIKANDEGRDYHNIMHADNIEGRKISHVYAVRKDDKNIFYNIDLIDSKHNNCFKTDLYFETSEGFLIISEYLDAWINKTMPTSRIEDVSEKFKGIIGRTVKKYKSYQNSINSHTSMGMDLIFDNGKMLRFASNFGETDEEVNIASYFEIL